MDSIRLVTLDEYIMGREKFSPLNYGMKIDAQETVNRVNLLLSEFGQYRKVTSGYRPHVFNVNLPNAAKKSNHMFCRACDLHDPEGDLDRFCMTQQDYLMKIGLWLESPTDTKGWCHVQIVPPASGHRVFIA